MRTIALAAVAAALGGPALAQDAHGNAAAMAHHQRTFSMVRAEVEATELEDRGLLEWEADAWFGGDRNKLWLKSEGELHGSDFERAEVQALWSRNVSTFFDVQAGVRHDFEPEGTTYLAVGVQGLAPYQFETEAHAFLSDRGDVTFRLKQSLDLLLTQRLVLEPEVELNAAARDVPELGLGGGVTDVEAGASLRYEFTRKFAPYVAVRYERSLGETAAIARAAFNDVETTTVRAGLRVWF